MTEDIPRAVIDDWPVEDLDWLHDDLGRGAEWRASEKRASKLMAERREARETA